MSIGSIYITVLVSKTSIINVIKTFEHKMPFTYMFPIMNHLMKTNSLDGAMYNLEETIKFLSRYKI